MTRLCRCAGALGEVAAADAKGALLWCDEPADWLARLAAASVPARSHLLRSWSPAIGVPAIGLLACLQPEAVPAMAKLGVDLASRFLFAWPHPPPYRPLAGRKAAASDQAFAALRRLAQVPGTAGAPTILQVEEKRSARAGCLPGQAAPRGRRDRWVGAGMAGKGPRHRRRLIGCLALLDWSVAGNPATLVTPTLWREGPNVSRQH